VLSDSRKKANYDQELSYSSWANFWQPVTQVAFALLSLGLLIGQAINVLLRGDMKQSQSKTFMVFCAGFYVLTNLKLFNEIYEGVSAAAQNHFKPSL